MASLPAQPTSATFLFHRVAVHLTKAVPVTVWSEHMLVSRRLGAHLELQKASAGGAAIGRGARGKHVAALQDLLVDLGHAMPRSMKPGGFDGIFGEETDKKVRAFQKAAGLKQDGLVGPRTLAALDGIIARRPDLDTPSPLREAQERRLDSSFGSPNRS
jgi:murein L,D-transpeptidase YcbB/YkuD